MFCINLLFFLIEFGCYDVPGDRGESEEMDRKREKDENILYLLEKERMSGRQSERESVC